MKAYFSHDEGARNDPKLVKVLMRLGQAGKGVYWDLVEMLYEQGGHLPLAEIESYAFALRTEPDLITSLINDFGLFAKDADRFWSETALERLQMRNDKAERRAAAGAKGGKARAEREAAAKALLEQEQSNTQAMLEQSLSPAQASKGKEIKEKEKEGRKEPSPAPSSSPSAKKEPETYPDEAPVFQRENFFAFARKIQYGHADLGHYLGEMQLKAERLNEQRTAEGWETYVLNFFKNEVKHSRLTLSAPEGGYTGIAKPEPAPMPADPTDLWGWNTAEPATTYQPTHEPA